MSKLPEPKRTLSGEIRKDRLKARRMLNSSPFFGTGIHPTAGGGMESDSFDGDLATNDAGTTGWAFNDQKVALGEVILRPGSVSNDALANPVIPQVARLYTEGFSLTTSYASKDSASITVPDGCTRLLAVVSASMYCVNQNTTGGSDGSGGDAIYVRATLAGSNTGGSPVGLSGSNGFTTTTSSDSFQLTGLTPGGTVAFGVEGKSGYQSIPSYVDNWVKAVATLIWLR